MHSPEDWWRRVEDKKAVAVEFKERREHTIEAWDACGTAVEFALKAYILKNERLNRWPDRVDRPDLYTHDLLRLLQVAGLSRNTSAAFPRAELRTVLLWTREHEYGSYPVPRKLARQMFEATFGRKGVIEWLRCL